MRARWNYILLGVIIAILIVSPNFMSRTNQGIAILTLLTIYLCVAWNISYLPGLFSFMNPIFYGGGAYVSSLLWLEFNISPWLGMFGGAAAAVLVAVVFGWLCFRFKLPILSFAIFTLALSTIAVFIVHAIPAVNQGLAVPYSGTNPWYYQFQSKIAFYYIILALVVGIVLLCRHIMKSKLGINFRAIRENERAASASGIDVLRYKLIALSISAALSAFAGTFWAQYYRFIGPEIVGTTQALVWILFTVVGGLGTLWGPVVGAGMLVPLGEVLSMQFPHLPGVSLIVYGVIILAILLGLRAGIVPVFSAWYEKRRLNRASKGSLLEKF